MRNKNVWQLIFILLTCCGSIHAQVDDSQQGRQVMSHYQLGYGAVNVLDTYLSQEKYRGNGITLLSLREARKEGSSWSTLIQNQFHLSTSKDRAGNESMLEGSYNYMWGRYYAWEMLNGQFRLQAGAMANLGLGFLYNTRNSSNNPAQGRLSLHVMPSGIASYHFILWKLKWKVRYELELPLFGVMFSPNYGQSYYEIFSQGNYDHNVVPTTFVSAPNFRQQLGVECTVCRGLTLSLGYLGDWQQASVNNLKQHIYHNAVMLGVVKRMTILK